MRVLFVTADFPSPGNAQNGIFILRRVQAIAALGHDVAVFQPWPLAPPIREKWKRYARAAEYDRVQGIPVHRARAPIGPRFIGIEYLPLFLKDALEREIDRFRPDVLHASYLIPGGQLAVRQGRVPTILTTHGFDSYDLPYRRPGLRRATIEAITNAGRVTAVSGYLAQCVQRLVTRDVDVIWNGADERFFYPRDRAQCRAELDLPADRTIVAYAGYLIVDKGVHELIEATARIPAENRPLLVFAGEGDQREALQTKAASLNVDTVFLGAVAHERIAAVFGAANVVTLPSYIEGLPNVVCEAMLSARAVVASTAGGIPEIVQDGESGLLVPPREVEPLAQALTRACCDAHLREKLADRARDFAAQNLTWRVSAMRYVALYEEVVQASRAMQTTTPTRTQYAS